MLTLEGFGLRVVFVPHMGGHLLKAYSVRTGEHIWETYIHRGEAEETVGKYLTFGYAVVEGRHVQGHL